VFSSTPRPHFITGKNPVPIVQEAGWAPGPVWMGGKSRLYRDSIPDRSARSSVGIPTELPGPVRDMIIHNYGNSETNQHLLCSHFRYVIAICAPTKIRQSWKAFAVLGCCELWIGSWLPTFRDNMSAPSSREKMSKTV